MEIGFDVISDLNLSPRDSFVWDGKATSLNCIVAGNISNDLCTIHRVLWTLIKHYNAVFFIGGVLEFSGVPDIAGRARDLIKICAHLGSVAYLHHHVIVIDGVAILGATGWYSHTEFIEAEADRLYLINSIKKLQLHRDVKHIVVVTNSVPDKEFYFGEDSEIDFPLSVCLNSDTEKKISHWIYGQCEKNVDLKQNNITYINNAAHTTEFYWPKRISI